LVSVGHCGAQLNLHKPVLHMGALPAMYRRLQITVTMVGLLP